MAEWTGELYFFYNDNPIEIVFKAFKQTVLELGFIGEVKHNELCNEYSIIFYKDQAMLDYHLEHGYNTDLNNEGCFTVEAKKTSLHSKANFIEYDNKVIPADEWQYDRDRTHFIFNEIFHYTLVVPDLIEDSEFSKKIYQLFKQSIFTDKQQSTDEQ